MLMNKIDKELGVVQKSEISWDADKNQIMPYYLEMQKQSPQAELATITSEDDIDNDYKYQRENFYNLVERGTDAINGILELAKEGEHPRAYEVAGNLIKQVAEVAEKLGDLQEKMRRLKEVPDNAPKNVTNALFVGSTAELQKMIKDK